MENFTVIQNQQLMNGGSERIYTDVVYDSDHFLCGDGMYSGDTYYEHVYYVWDDGYARPGGYQDWDMFTPDGIFLGPNWAD